ncbi:AAC(3)-I family aminoglycoside 3-N-acetyltransferase [Pedobacter yulinensis]|uniref:AAC(3)-I family aminoglycoside 3-N-acetyltransferase n=1 Tax=Pedobacter yulinensis TaxID=2126353 RepID=A0A2T3HNY6_9SPHI|nr:GNAT family N-acetyltransferase [Pedobacter yulinensis]PST84152.1 AAC(3)-I family aminoglycoside 3-N-acetyltransferase [Pedobacter yulinensis]
MNIDIQRISPGNPAQLIELIGVYEEVFAMKDFRLPDAAHLQALLLRPSFMAFVALAEGRVVGGMTVYVLDQCYSTRPLAYIFDLAVLQSYQRRGIGTKLIKFSKDYCRELGFEEVFVQADVADDYALEFYRSTNPSDEEHVRHFYYTL